MKYLYIAAGIAGLLMLIIPALMHFAGSMEMTQMKNLMFVGTLIWFAAAIPWLGKKHAEGDN